MKKNKDEEESSVLFTEDFVNIIVSKSLGHLIPIPLIPLQNVLNLKHGLSKQKIYNSMDSSSPGLYAPAKHGPKDI